MFQVEQFGQADKEKASDSVNKSLNPNPVGNVESCESSIDSTLSVEIAEGLLI